jgi:FMN reductase
MIPVNATMLVGNPRKGSRTVAVAHHLAKVIRTGLAEEGVDLAEPNLVDLSDLGSMVPPRLPVEGAEPVRCALATIRQPGLLIVVSPTFKGSYTGLLKMFLDLLPLEALSHTTVAVPLMTAGWAQHRSAVDSQLRPLLMELGAQVPTRGVSVLEGEFADLEQVTAPWATTAIPMLAAILHRLHRN